MDNLLGINAFQSDISAYDSVFADTKKSSW